MHLDYAHEKLTSAIRVLAIHPAKIRNRLRAANDALFTLREEHFPEELREDWRWIHHQMTRYGPEFWRASFSDEEPKQVATAVEHTMRRIRPNTAVEIARRIVHLHYKVDCLLYPR